MYSCHPAVEIYLILQLLVLPGSAFVLPSVLAFSNRGGHGLVHNACRTGNTNLCVAISHGSVVTIDCRLKPEGDFIPEPLFDGIVLEDFDTPQRLTFVLGEGNYLPGLHDLVATMLEGQTVKNVSVDAGWGARNSNLEAEISFESLKESGLDLAAIREGVQLVLENGVRASVTKVSTDAFTIDANPPMAGASYLATVKLISVEPGPMVELEYSSNAGEGTKYQIATFALGCFWGGELAYQRERGVIGTKVGYTQGHAVNPSYEEVCTGTTGHTEAMMISYDPSTVSYERLVQLAMDRLGENKYLLSQVGNDK
jgi:FKBP-type peptidyl-prolyl cis-trans isomerase 2